MKREVERGVRPTKKSTFKAKRVCSGWRRPKNGAVPPRRELLQLECVLKRTIWGVWDVAVPTPLCVFLGNDRVFVFGRGGRARFSLVRFWVDVSTNHEKSRRSRQMNTTT